MSCDHRPPTSLYSLSLHSAFCSREENAAAVCDEPGLAVQADCDIEQRVNELDCHHALIPCLRHDAHSDMQKGGSPAELSEQMFFPSFGQPNQASGCELQYTIEPGEKQLSLAPWKHLAQMRPRTGSDRSNRTQVAGWLAKLPYASCPTSLRSRRTVPCRI